MRCPYCAHPDTRVADSRLAEPGDAVRRRRECLACARRFTTHERADAPALTVVKRDGRGEPFDRQKLLAGLLRAATKRPLQVPQLEAVADSIEEDLRRSGGEARAERIGELALRGLIALDRVAAIRFASVYRNFEDLAEFEAELRRLESEPVAGADQLPLEAPADGPLPSGPTGRIVGPSATVPGQRRQGQVFKRRGHAEHP